jgi:hypothetical protein
MPSAQYLQARLEPNGVVASMDKLQLKGQNLGRVFNSRLGHACISCAIAHITRQPNLKLNTRPKQLLAFAFPSYSQLLPFKGMKDPILALNY